ncbi:hypothetical protein Nmel_001815, partial [Mimus melanotis]
APREPGRARLPVLAEPGAPLPQPARRGPEGPKLGLAALATQFAGHSRGAICRRDTNLRPRKRRDLPAPHPAGAAAPPTP